MPILAPYAEQHKTTDGSGDARPTALQIVKDQGLVGKLAGKVMLVTGCSSGIGVETARAFHATGADVYMTVRDVARGQSVLEDIKKDGGGGGRLELIRMELDSLESVRAAAKDFLSRSDRLNVLVNNAGVMATPEGTTQDGFETQFGTNHLGHFLLFQLLKPTLLASATPSFASRVVCVSSVGHQGGQIHFEDVSLRSAPGGYTPFGAYGQSKTANIYMANEIDRRYGARGLHALSLHPGGIWTPLQKHVDKAVFDGWKAIPGIEKAMKSTAQGAATTVWAALAREWEGKGGRYLEDCQEALPKAEAAANAGYAPYAYDEEKEKRLWAESLKMVGMADDD